MVRSCSAVMFFTFALCLAAYGADGRTLDAGDLRIRVIAGYGWIASRFDDEGDRNRIEEGAGAARLVNVGLALELGLIDWLTLGVGWVPGYNLWTKLDYLDPPFFPLQPGSLATYNGPLDVQVGVRFRIVGSRGLIPSEWIGASLGPLGVIPMPFPDWDKQRDRWKSSERYVLDAPDKHHWGYGGVIFLDSEPAPGVFLSLSAKLIEFVPRKEERIYDERRIDVDHRYEASAELEASYSWTLPDGQTAKAGTTLGFLFAPGDLIDGESVGEERYRLRLQPYLGLEDRVAGLPAGVRVFYAADLLGRNEPALGIVGLELTTTVTLPGLGHGAPTP